MTLNNRFAIDFEERPRPKLWLLKPDFTRIDRLVGVTKLNSTIKHTNLNSINFQISPEIFDELSHQQKRNPVYDKIKNKFIIKYEYNNFVDYFIIEEIKKSSTETDTLLIAADSLANELSKKNVSEMEMKGASLESIITSLLSSYAPLWTLDRISPKLTEIKREIVGTQTTVMAVIEEANKLFDAVPYFDNINRKISFKHKDEIGINRGLKIKENSYLKSFEDSLVSRDVVTRLIPIGNAGLTINSVNPAGTDYIEDFSYFMKPFKRDADRNVIEHSDYMSDELCHALLDYQEFYNSKKDDSELLNTKYSELLTEYGNEDFKLTQLKAVLQRIQDRVELLKPKQEYIDYGTVSVPLNMGMAKSSYYIVLIKNEGTLANVVVGGQAFQIKPGSWAYVKIDTEDFVDALKKDEKAIVPFIFTAATPKFRVISTRSSLNDYEEEDTKKIEEKYNLPKYTELVAYQETIVLNIQKRLKQLENERQALRSTMNPQKFLPEHLYKERELYIYDAFWQEENHTEAKALLEDAIKQLGKQNNLNRSVTINIINFIQSLEDKHNWGKLNAGDMIVFSNDRFKEKLKAYITDIGINHDENNIQLTISDAIDYKDDTTIISEKLASATSTASQVGFHKSQIKEQEGKLTKMGELIQAEWDANKKKIMAGNETVEIGQGGVKVISNIHPEEYIVMLGGIVAMTKDGGESFKTGITPDGINAEMLIGKFVVGENLWFENESGTIKFDKDGLNISVDKFNLTSGSRNYFDVLKEEINETIEQKAVRITKEYQKEIDKAKEEAVDVQEVVETTTKTIQEAFADGVLTEIEKKSIRDSLATLEKENSEYIQQIELAKNHPFILQDDILLINTAEQNYENIYNTLVEEINLAIADDLATLEESKRVNDYIVSFRESIQSIMALVQQILERTRQNQIEAKFDEAMSFNIQLEEDLRDEMSDLSNALGDVEKNVKNAIGDGVVTATEIEAIKTALLILSSEEEDVQNRFDSLYNNPNLEDTDKTILKSFFDAFHNSFVDYENYVNEMISDGIANDTERQNYQTKFDNLSVTKANFSTAYGEALLKVADTYSKDAIGQANSYTDSLRTDYVNDIKDINDNIKELQDDFLFFSNDGKISDYEKSRLKVQLDMLDRESMDLEENYQSVSANSKIGMLANSNLSAARSDYIIKHDNLKNVINSVITDGLVTPEEITEANNALAEYNAALSNYSTNIQEAIDSIARGYATAAENGAKEYTSTEIEKTDEKIRLKASKSGVSDIVSTIDLLADGITLTSDNDGDKSILSVNPMEIQLKAERISLGNDDVSDVVITNGVAVIKNLVADKIQGGTLTLGGVFFLEDRSQPPVIVTEDDGTSVPTYPIIEQKFEDASFVRYDNMGNPTFSVNEEGVTIKDLTVTNLKVENTSLNSAMVSKSTEDKVFYVHPYPSDNMYEETIIANADEMAMSEEVEPIYELKYDGSAPDRPLPCSKIPDVIPDILYHTYTFIVSNLYSTQDYSQFSSELISINGVTGHGKVIINLNKKYVAWSVSFNKCTIECYINNGTMFFDQDSSEVTFAIRNNMSTYLAIEGLTFQCFRIPAATDNLLAIQCHYQGYTFIENCNFYHFRDGVYATQSHTVLARNNGGAVNRYAIYANFVAQVNLMGTSVSSLVSGKSIFNNNGATVNKIGTVTFPEEPTSGDNSKTGTAPTVAPVAKTRTWTTEIANNKYSGYWATNYWKGRPVSGRWSGYGSQSGVWIFPTSMRDTLKGKTIKKITISIGRITGYGYNKSVPFNIRMHKRTTLPTGTTNPDYSSNYKTVSLPYGTRKTFDVTSTFKDSINKGTFAGFGVLSSFDAAHYAVLAAKCSVTVTYV